MKIKVGSLFDGIGGAPLSAVLSGAEPVWASEIEKVPTSITKRHFPNMKHYGDITQINGAEIEPVDIIVGGSPCQDLSVAGKRAGLEGARSGLFMDQVRIVKEMRNATSKQTGNGSDKLPRPRYMVWENVPGAFSSNKGEDFRAVLEETAKVADPTISIPRSVNGWANAGSILADRFSISWRTFDAQYWGVPQRRRRIYLVADFGGHTAPEICFESESVPGDITEGGETGQRIATDAERGSGSSGELVLNDQGGSVMGVSYGVTGTLRAEAHGHQPIVCYSLQGNMIGRADHNGPQGSGVNEDVSFTLNTVDRHAVCYGFASRQQSMSVTEDCANPILSTDYKEPQVVCYGIDQQGGKSGANFTENIAPTMLSDSHGTPQAVCYGFSYKASSHAGTIGIEQEKAPTLLGARHDAAIYYQHNPACNQGGIAVVEPTVRRLTPLECERLQGYPDGWTALDHEGKAVSDTQRYKALGNSFAVPNALFVISRCVKQLQKE